MCSATMTGVLVLVCVGMLSQVTAPSPGTGCGLVYPLRQYSPTSSSSIPHGPPLQNALQVRAFDMTPSLPLILSTFTPSSQPILPYMEAGLSFSIVHPDDTYFPQQQQPVYLYSHNDDQGSLHLQQPQLQVVDVPGPHPQHPQRSSLSCTLSHSQQTNTTSADTVTLPQNTVPFQPNRPFILFESTLTSSLMSFNKSFTKLNQSTHVGPVAMQPLTVSDQLAARQGTSVGSASVGLPSVSPGSATTYQIMRPHINPASIYSSLVQPSAPCPCLAAVTPHTAAADAGLQQLVQTTYRSLQSTSKLWTNGPKMATVTTQQQLPTLVPDTRQQQPKVPHISPSTPTPTAGPPTPSIQSTYVRHMDALDNTLHLDINARPPGDVATHRPTTFWRQHSPGASTPPHYNIHAKNPSTAWPRSLRR